MNKYTKLSDFEINLKVARIRLTDGNYGWCAHAGLVKRYVTDDKGLCMTYDPCNNPSDAMPIIIENKICTAFDVFAEERDGGSWVASPAYGFTSERTRSNNLYRAAMEVFLMMKDEK